MMVSISIVLLKSAKEPEPVVEVVEPQVTVSADIQEENVVDTEAVVVDPSIEFVEIDFSNAEVVTLDDVLAETKNNENNEPKGDA